MRNSPHLISLQHKEKSEGELFKRQRHKIVKHTQKIHQLLPANYLRVFDHFVELSLKGLRDSQGDYGRFKLKQRVLLIYYQGFLIKSATVLDYTFLRHNLSKSIILADICLLKVKNRSAITRCEICSKLTIKRPKPRRWRYSSVFIVNFEHI